MVQIHKIVRSYDNALNEEKLNEIAADGWQLVAAFPWWTIYTKPIEYHYIFVKEVEDGKAKG